MVTFGERREHDGRVLEVRSRRRKEAQSVPSVGTQYGLHGNYKWVATRSSHMLTSIHVLPSRGLLHISRQRLRCHIQQMCTVVNVSQRLYIWGVSRRCTMRTYGFLCSSTQPLPFHRSFCVLHTLLCVVRPGSRVHSKSDFSCTKRHGRRWPVPLERESPSNRMGHDHVYRSCSCIHDMKSECLCRTRRSQATGRKALDTHGTNGHVHCIYGAL